MSSEVINRERLVGDVKNVIADAEDLLKATATDASERVKSLRPRLEESMRSTKLRLVEAERAVLDTTRSAAEATDRYAHDNPWKTAGIAATVGLLLGLIIGRRD